MINVMIIDDQPKLFFLHLEICICEVFPLPAQMKYWNKEFIKYSISKQKTPIFLVLKKVTKCINIVSCDSFLIHIQYSQSLLMMSISFE